MLAGPAAWALQLVIGSELPEFMCSAGARETDVYGVGIETVILITSAVTSAIAILGALVSYRCWRRRRSDDEATGGRAGWMAMVGILTNGLFLILIIVGFFPAAFLSECGTSL